MRNSSLRLIRHFFLIPLRWRIKQILLYLGMLFTSDGKRNKEFDSLVGIVDTNLSPYIGKVNTV